MRTHDDDEEDVIEPDYEQALPEDDDPDSPTDPESEEEVTDIVPVAPRRHSRRAGSDRAQDTRALASGETAVDFHRLFRTFDVNWNTRTPYSVLGSRARRALLLNWDPEDLKSVEQTSGLYNTIPRICPGMEREVILGNPEANPPIPDRPGELKCACARRYGRDTSIWRGHPCPAEKLTALRHLVQYVRDMEIKPTDYVDVQQVVEIVKMHIYEGRCDEELQSAEKIHDMQVGSIDQRKGDVYWNKKTPAAIETQERLANRRIKLYEKLVASRDAKDKKRVTEMKAVAAIGDAKANLTAAEMMSSLAEEAIASRRIVGPAAPLALETQALEADYGEETPPRVEEDAELSDM